MVGFNTKIMLATKPLKKALIPSSLYILRMVLLMELFSFSRVMRVFTSQKGAEINEDARPARRVIIVMCLGWN